MNPIRLGLYLAVTLLSLYAVYILMEAPKQRGHIHELDDKPQGVVMQLEERVKNNPNDMAALIDLGHYYLQNQLFDKAVEVFAHASHVDENHAEAYVDWAIALDKSGKALEAQKMFLTATEKFPDYSDSWLQLGLQYNSTLPDREKAIYYFEEFLKRDQNSPMATRVREELERIRGGQGN